MHVCVIDFCVPFIVQYDSEVKVKYVTCSYSSACTQQCVIIIKFSVLYFKTETLYPTILFICLYNTICPVNNSFSTPMTANMINKEVNLYIKNYVNSTYRNI